PIAADSPVERVVDAAELAKHNSATSCWIAIDGIVYDVTDFLGAHPAGKELLLNNSGKDISFLFKTLHPPGTLQKVRSLIKQVGTSPTQAAEPVDPVEQRRAALFPPELVINCAEFEDLAKEVLGEESAAWSFIYSWADDGASFRAARSSFSHIRFLPRINIPVRDIDSRTKFLGDITPLPIFMAPTGTSVLAHPDGEFNVTRAAAKTGIPQCVSNAASKGVFGVLDERDAIVAAGGNKARIWLQLYIRNNRHENEVVLQEAARRGVGAILITVDLAAMGNREAHARDGRRKAVMNGATVGNWKETLASPRMLAVDNIYERNMSWDDIAWVRKHAPNVPVLVKGVATIDDVALAKQHGADGVVLSNHGGRQLDHAPPPMATLVRLRQTAPHLLDDPKFEVYVDGGVTRGSDVLKAICLGAKGVGLGRTMLYAQACYGEAGVLRACEIMQAEIQRGMRLLGAKTIKDLKPELVELLDGLVGVQMKSGPLQRT
ncbi:L-mandelate dehydrogenase, partial [Mycena rebaudengoi]